MRSAIAYSSVPAAPPPSIPLPLPLDTISSQLSHSHTGGSAAARAVAAVDPTSSNSNSNSTHTNSSSAAAADNHAPPQPVLDHDSFGPLIDGTVIGDRIPALLVPQRDRSRIDDTVHQIDDVELARALKLNNAGLNTNAGNGRSSTSGTRLDITSNTFTDDADADADGDDTSHDRRPASHQPMISTGPASSNASGFEELETDCLEGYRYNRYRPWLLALGVILLIVLFAWVSSKYDQPSDGDAASMTTRPRLTPSPPGSGGDSALFNSSIATNSTIDTDNE